MNKKTLPIAFALVLSMLMLVPMVSALYEPKDVLRWDEAFYVTIGEPETVDPAWAYDTSSSELIWNVYDSLIFWAREAAPGVPQGFEPRLATSWWVSTDGLTYNFTLRPDAKWHNPADPLHPFVEPRDVEYSIERMMTLDHVGGPDWMVLYPLTGYYTTDELINMTDPNRADVQALGQAIDASVTSDVATNTVQFNLLTPTVGWMQIIGQTFGAVYSLDWALMLKGQGRSIWDGTWGAKPTWDEPYTSWLDFADPYASYTASPFQTDAGGNFAPAMMGSGPYKFDRWDTSYKWEISRNADYYLGWPAPTAFVDNNGDGIAETPTVRQADYFERVTHLLVESWPDRKFMFLTPTTESMADLANVPRDYMGDVMGQPHIRGTKNLPVLSVVAAYFNYEVSVTSAFVGSKPALKTSTGWVDPKYDLLSDIHLRKGMAWAFDYAKFILDRYKGEAEVAASSHVFGLAYYNGSKPKMQQDLAKARYHLKMAWGGIDADGNEATMGDVTPGNVWNYGFKLELQFNAGNTMRQALTNMMRNILVNDVGFPTTTELLITTQGYAWGTNYIPAKNAWELSFFALGWVGDFADPDNFVFTFMHSSGDSAKFQNINWGNGWSADGHNEFYSGSGRLLPYTNALGELVTAINTAYVDHIVQAAAIPTNDRGALYDELADIWWGEMPTMTPAQPLGRHWERDTFQGWYYNSIGPGGMGEYWYQLYKGLDAEMTISNFHSPGTPDPGTGHDYGYIDDSEKSKLNAHFYDKFQVGGVWYTTEGSQGYNRVADVTYEGRQVTQTREMDGVDYLKGSLPLEQAIIPSGSDGLVNLWDIGLVYTQWNDYVRPSPLPA